MSTTESNVTGRRRSATAQEPDKPIAQANPTGPFYVLFFLSGFPALMYQIVWQRVLFTFYGVNIESVTVIVTVFMLGLGLGSLAGGMLSRVRNLPLLGVFGTIEISIGFFGAGSLALFHRVALLSAGTSMAKTGVITMGILLVPTLLMGSTLPLLVAYFVRVTRNVGASVGGLYSVNTLGSAVACLISALFVMRWWGESGSVRAAAVLNLLIGCSALCLQVMPGNRPGESDALGKSPEDSPRAMPFAGALALSALVGFIALAYEIVWYRLYSFTSGGAAPSFALVLACYLGGIAFGSLFVRDLCSQRLVRDPGRTLGFLAGLIIWAGIASFLVGPALAATVPYLPYPATFPLLFGAAALLGSAFPLLSHASVTAADHAGSRLSYLYLANILGSATGSFLVGFVLMDYFSLRGICLILLAAGSIPVLFIWSHNKAGMNRCITLGLSAAAGIALLSSQLFSNLYEKLLYAGAYSVAETFAHTVETRSGIVNVSQDGTVFGGGVYDGRLNVDPTHDTNGIFRAYAISSFHRHPHDVLMIGLSSGSWAQVIANTPEVSRLTIVEINPGYLRVIALYPQVASLLRNPKVEIVMDDGRRWLVRNPNRKFDLIVMNTSFHWRAHMSNLLSVEFLRLVRPHLNPGGIHYYNTTGSGEVQFTGASVFPYALRVWSFLAVSDSPILVDKSRWEQSLVKFKIAERPVFDLNNSFERASLNEMLSLADTLRNSSHDPEDKTMESGDSIRERWKGKRLITDDNMGTEWQ